MAQSDSKQLQSSLTLFHSIGYGLLLLGLIEIINLVFPFHFMDAVWEFQTLGAVVERVPLPLIGLVLIFYKEAEFRTKWELKVLKLLSQASLLAGIIFLILIFLCASNALRVNKLNNDRIAAQTNEQLSQLQQIEQQVDKATVSQLEGFLARVNAQGVSSDIKEPQELRSRLLTELNRSKTNVLTDANQLRKTKRLALTKTAVKWGLGCLIAGDLFIRVWQATRWSRKATKR